MRYSSEELRAYREEHTQFISEFEPGEEEELEVYAVDDSYIGPDDELVWDEHSQAYWVISSGNYQNRTQRNQEALLQSGLFTMEKPRWKRFLTKLLSFLKLKSWRGSKQVKFQASPLTKRRRYLPSREPH